MIEIITLAKKHEIEIQGKIEVELKNHGCTPVWWKYTDKKIFDDLLDLIDLDDTYKTEKRIERYTEEIMKEVKNRI